MEQHAIGRTKGSTYYSRCQQNAEHIKRTLEIDKSSNKHLLQTNRSLIN